MACRLCLTCKESWPPHPGFGKCPACLAKTQHRTGESPYGLREALELRNTFRANHLYEQREAERLKQGGLTPEQQGQLDARRLLKQTEELEKTAANS
ncbi:MAG TPA: hypothetical protein VGP44_05175 [Gemmatimonadales bacterium]|nr:hypothetical protein [Gemmatimonadales bacterium]